MICRFKASPSNTNLTVVLVCVVFDEIVSGTSPETLEIIESVLKAVNTAQLLL